MSRQTQSSSFATKTRKFEPSLKNKSERNKQQENNKKQNLEILVRWQHKRSNRKNLLPDFNISPTAHQSAIPCKENDIIHMIFFLALNNLFQLRQLLHFANHIIRTSVRFTNLTIKSKKKTHVSCQTQTNQGSQLRVHHSTAHCDVLFSL
jgi:hypothetical protein